MQEELCSHRLLIFINNEVYYRCHEGTFYERNFGIADHSDFLGYSLMPAIYQGSDYFASFTDLMMYYTRRDLTYPSDILRASLGMLRKLSNRAKIEFIEGLPAPLDRSLLFIRRTPLHKLRARREGFPSYSWTGWTYIPVWKEDMSLREARIFGNGLTRRDVARETWIAWYCISPHGNLYAIGSHGIQKPSTCREYEASREISGNELQMLPLSPEHIQMNDHNPPTATFTLLRFWTISVFLTISLVQSSDNSEGLHHYATFGIDEFPCGALEVDFDDLRKDTAQEFALICEYEDVWKSGVEVGYWAMLLKRIGPLVERRGILKLPKEALDKTLPPGPSWTSYILG